MIRITSGGHFQVDFANGFTLSVFNGYGSYSDGRDMGDAYKTLYEYKTKSMEIAVLYNGNLQSINHPILTEIGLASEIHAIFSYK